MWVGIILFWWRISRLRNAQLFPGSWNPCVTLRLVKTLSSFPILPTRTLNNNWFQVIHKTTGKGRCYWFFFPGRLIYCLVSFLDLDRVGSIFILQVPITLNVLHCLSYFFPFVVLRKLPPEHLLHNLPPKLVYVINYELSGYSLLCFGRWYLTCFEGTWGEFYGQVGLRN